ncbi:MAG: RibD family protein [Propionibacteriaceae bacterium]
MDATSTKRPYVLMSSAMSVDGCIDDAGPVRLVLSNDEDFDRVDQLRAEADAILVGATTIRRDRPRLLVRSTGRRARRVEQGRSASPTKVTISSSGDLDPAAEFFTTGGDRPIVYVPTTGLEPATIRLGAVADVVAAGGAISPVETKSASGTIHDRGGIGPFAAGGAIGPVDPHRVLADLAGRGIGQLLIEGGGTVNALFLGAGLVDELQLTIAPLVVGEPTAPRWLPADRPWPTKLRLRLVGARTLGELVVLRYRTDQARG